MLEQFKHYYKIAQKMQHIKFEGNTKGFTKNDVGDDLAWNVPIYDVVNRRYAAFSSFTEAIYYKEKDPKGNGKYFTTATVPKDIHFATMCYLFRLCGSGINYVPNIGGGPPWGTHGFGNFWIVDAIRNGYYRRKSWIEQLPEKKFCDVKGYMLPMISGGMYEFINSWKAIELVDHIFYSIINSGKAWEIHKVVNYGNEWLYDNGYKRQNFVLCAFAMDLAEYFPHLVDPNSRVLVGTNAKKCLKLIFPDKKGVGTNLDTTNDCLQYLCDITGNHSLKYDMEDVACDFIRYINNFQSPDHIKANNGVVYKNSLTNE